MDPQLLALLDELSAFGRDNDGAQRARANKILNITPETGRLLWILVTTSGNGEELTYKRA